MNSIMNHQDLIAHHEKLSNHSLYQKIKTESDIQIFMESHVFAVWDFMTLLKRYKKKPRGGKLPWSTSRAPKNGVG